MRDKPEIREESVDAVRRRLLKAGLVAGGTVVAGTLPYEKPSVKSFFGTRAAYAQATGPTCGIIGVTRPEQPDGAASEMFTVTNTGTAPFDITSIDSSSMLWTIMSPPLPISLEPGESFDFSANLDCVAAGAGGPFEAEITFGTSSAFGPVACPVLNVSGSCVAECTIMPMSLDFEAPFGSFDEQDITVTNTGDAPWDVTAVNFLNVVPPGSQFTSDFAGVTTLLPGASLTITIRFDCGETDQTADAEVEGTSAAGAVTCDPVALNGVCLFEQ